MYDPRSYPPSESQGRGSFYDHLYDSLCGLTFFVRIDFFMRIDLCMTPAKKIPFRGINMYLILIVLLDLEDLT